MSRSFRSEERGSTLVFVGIALALFLGLVAMSFDLGRVAVTQTDLASYADSVALAAAAELDGGTDAIARATAAADGMISDRQTFGDGDAMLAGSGDYTLRFLSELPADDTAAPTAVTTDPREARYAWVTVNDFTVGSGFTRAFRVLRGVAHTDPSVSAEAIAGMTQMACDITPLMFCVPTGWEAEDHIGSTILLRSGGQGAAWGPGDFGFVDPNGALIDPAGPCAGLNGAQQYRCLIGATSGLTGCVAQRGIDIQPGQREGLARAFNTRFDIYTGSMQSMRTDPYYAPAPNVVKAIRRSSGGSGNGNGNGNGNQCIQSEANVEATGAMRLPPDICVTNGTCGRFGNGSWDRAGYLAANHGGSDPAVGRSYENAQAGSRWELYLAEIDAANAAGPDAPILTGAGLTETGRPVCSTQAPAPPERRLLIAAAVDCTRNPIGGAASGVPAAEFVVVFLTEPVGDRSTSPPVVDIYGEVVDVAGADGTGTGGYGGVFRDVVQLYR
ncbi:TadE/TadG family type IV pilus assembly protein [Wenxinia marina]|uniref:Flp pilus assembly protein TadG n=1 Tax=Wenxinia marina DSM 24838 TaxID=1123501 RepID=A0A0D0QEH6_9RHOB|nr:pilus assembly protein TadG-related protein [Wenxinia marina]KIQ69418.1 Flp pilus assembly protein TadG [Wenxinia marina DSM 24838]GGL58169.1 hypothetical protein GCM10011392_10770 [Wenxinia marina]